MIIVSVQIAEGWCGLIEGSQGNCGDSYVIVVKWIEESKVQKGLNTFNILIYFFKVIGVRRLLSK